MQARVARLGPGGLDPLEVLESLPQSIKDAFEKQDTPALQAAFGALPPDEAKHHFQRVVDSGLWVPGGSRGRRGWGSWSLRWTGAGGGEAEDEDEDEAGAEEGDSK